MPASIRLVEPEWLLSATPAIRGNPANGRLIYTTNAIESLNSVVRKALDNRKLFPHDQAAMKVVYLAMETASRRWTMPIRNWKAALNRFTIEFPDRMLETL